MEDSCLCCHSTNVDMHHLKTRKSGGSDDDYNLVPLCRQHHVMAHQVGHNKMASSFYRFRKGLIDRGWEFCDFRGRWVRPLEESANERME